MDRLTVPMVLTCRRYPTAPLLEHRVSLISLAAMQDMVVVRCVIEALAQQIASAVVVCTAT